MLLPDPTNRFQSDHATLLLDSYRKWLGRDLIDGGGSAGERAQRLFKAPFFVASHDRSEDPVLTYGNQTALDLFEMSWDAFTSTPSRFTAEAPERSERDRLLSAVRERGYIDDYSGIRVSSSGRRFLIKDAVVWNLVDDSGQKVGQAATFSEWQALG